MSILSDLDLLRHMSPGWGPYKQAAFHGLLQWVGEAVIGLIPLADFLATHIYSRLPISGLCSPGSLDKAKGIYTSCFPSPETASQEVCILAVVISGLAVLSVAPIASRPREITAWTRPLIVVAVVSLIFGSLFYALFSAHMAENADTLSYVILMFALLSSLFLAIEGAILEAEVPFDQGTEAPMHSFPSGATK